MRLTLDAKILVCANGRATGRARKIFEILSSDSHHDLVLSRYILDEIARVLAYPRLQTLYRLTEEEIREYVREIEETCRLVQPVVTKPIVLTDPADDPVLYTALDGNAHVLCTLNRDFSDTSVLAVCARNGLQVMTDVDLLRVFRGQK